MQLGFWIKILIFFYSGKTKHHSAFYLFEYKNLYFASQVRGNLVLSLPFSNRLVSKDVKISRLVRASRAIVGEQRLRQ